jgi:hypothetical protein
VLQRKVLTPADSLSVEDLAGCILAFQARYEVLARPFEWRFTRADLGQLLARCAAREHDSLTRAA